MNEEQRLNFVFSLDVGDTVGIYDVPFGDVSQAKFAGNDIVARITPTGVIRLWSTRGLFDRQGFGKGRSRPNIGNSGKVLGIPKWPTIIGAS